MADGFDRDSVVKASLELFWRRGYEATSIDDIVHETGANRYQLYNAFGGKKAIFLQALSVYADYQCALFTSLVEEYRGEPLRAIRELMGRTVEEMAKRRSGCLMGSVACGLAQMDQNVHERFQLYCEGMRSAVIEAFLQAEELGQLHPRLTPDAAFDLLLTLKHGIAARTSAGECDLEKLNLTLDAGIAALSAP